MLEELAIWLKMRNACWSEDFMSQTFPAEKDFNNLAHTLHLEKEKLSPESTVHNSHSC